MAGRAANSARDELFAMSRGTGNVDSLLDDKIIDIHVQMDSKSQLYKDKIGIFIITKNQQYAMIYTTPLFYVLAPTCFDSSLPSSGSILNPSELLEIQIEWLVYLKYISVTYLRYTTHSICISGNLDGSKTLPDNGRPLPKHVGAST
jgi:hypothetical protein